MKKKTLTAAILFFFCVILGLAPVKSVEASASAVRLSAEKLTLTVGGSKTLKMYVRNTACNANGWKSSKPSVASVSKKGVVKAKKAGTAVITCKTGFGYSLKCKVTVKKAAPLVETSKYVNKDYRKLVKKVSGIKRLDASKDPAGIGNIYVVQTKTTTYPFIRYKKSNKKINFLQISNQKNLSLYGVKLGMTASKAKAALKKNKCTWKETKTYDNGRRVNLSYKKSGHTITIFLENGKVTCCQWNA